MSDDDMNFNPVNEEEEIIEKNMRKVVMNYRDLVHRLSLFQLHLSEDNANQNSEFHSLKNLIPRFQESLTQRNALNDWNAFIQFREGLQQELEALIALDSVEKQKLLDQKTPMI